MNDTTVFTTGTYFKDDNVAKVQMTRSYDTWVLLLVVSVLSTLLSVIVVISCLWICFKYCIHPSVFKGRLCMRGCRQSFPPPQREFVELEEFGERINSIMHPRGTKGFASNNKTGASEQLGYRPHSDIPVPVLPAPRSWTPSPPFPQDNCHSRSHANMYVGCHNRSRQHCCSSCFTHEDYCRVHEKFPPPCQLCPFDLRERLSNLQRCSREIHKHSIGNFSETNQSAYRPPANTPVSLKQTSNTPICENVELSSDDTQRRNCRRKLSNNEFEHFNKSLSHSATPRYKNTTESENYSKSYSSNYFVSNATERSNDPSVSAIDNQTSFPSGIHEETQQGNMNSVLLHSTSLSMPRDMNNNHYDQSYSRGGKTIYPKSFGRSSRVKPLPKRKRANTPIAVFLESPSSESSSDKASALNRTSNTYWKLYHPKGDGSGGEKRKEGQVEEEEEGRYDNTPSMSWDHLTPDPSPTHEILQPKVEVDPTKTRAIFYHERKLENDIACSEENTLITAPTSSVAQT